MVVAWWIAVYFWLSRQASLWYNHPTTQPTKERLGSEGHWIHFGNWQRQDLRGVLRIFYLLANIWWGEWNSTWARWSHGFINRSLESVVEMKIGHFGRACHVMEKTFPGRTSPNGLVGGGLKRPAKKTWTNANTKKNKQQKQLYKFDLPSFSSTKLKHHFAWCRLRWIPKKPSSQTSTTKD